MKKVAVILVMSMLLSSLGLTKDVGSNVNVVVPTINVANPMIKSVDLSDNPEEQYNTDYELADKSFDLSKPAITVLGNIKISATSLNVREDKSSASDIVNKVYFGEIYEVLARGKDTKGRVWYKINPEFGVTGWVAGWYCKKTKESINTAIESKPGKLYYECTKESLFIQLLLLEDYSLSNVLKLCGNNYTKNSEYDNYVTYEYKDGTKIEVYENQEVISIEVGQRSFTVNQIQRVKADLFQNKGNEVIIFTGESFIIIEAKSKKILREYHTGYLYLDEFKVGDFVGDGKLDLYLNGLNVSGSMRNIYEIMDNSFVRRYHINSFHEYGKGINAKMDKGSLKLDINIGNYKASEISELPERAFYNTKDVKDKNELLSVDPYWSMVLKNGNWYINVCYTVNLVMMNYYWGPPGDDVVANETMYNDLANIDILLDVSSNTPEITEVTHTIKYNNPSLNKVKPILYEEGMIVDGPELGTSMLEAYKTLGGKLPKDDTESQALNGVTLFEFCGQVVNIKVESTKYETTRGLKVGDDITKVETLYGKPDVGFSGDPYVEYKFCYEDHDGSMKLNYYRTMTIYYKDGLVSAYGFNQVILD